MSDKQAEMCDDTVIWRNEEKERCVICINPDKES